jgi:hypothetical protein
MLSDKDLYSASPASSCTTTPRPTRRAWGSGRTRTGGRWWGGRRTNKAPTTAAPSTSRTSSHRVHTATRNGRGRSWRHGDTSRTTLTKCGSGTTASPTCPTSPNAGGSAPRAARKSFERLAASLFDCRKRIAKYQRADNWVRCGTYKQPKHRQRSAQLERWGAEREFRRLRRRGLL